MFHLCLKYVLWRQGSVIPAPKSVMNDRTSIVTASHHLQLSSRCIRSNSAKQGIATLYPDKSRSLLNSIPSIQCSDPACWSSWLLILINLEHIREPAFCSYRPPPPQNRHTKPKATRRTWTYLPHRYPQDSTVKIFMRKSAADVAGTSCIKKLCEGF